MKCVGITAEYNPFHNGHAYQIAEAKRLSGADGAVVVMSGSFVQRGEPACFDKFTRARLAGLGGADLVIELPDALSCACAERFAYGGVKLLAAAGLVDTIAFGSECGDIEAIRRSAGSVPAPDELRSALDAGLSYPKAIAQCTSNGGISAALGENGLDAPNDLLAVEYVRQIQKIAPHIRPLAVKRVGSGYNSGLLSDRFASASAIRSAIGRGEWDRVSAFVPEFVYKAMLSGRDNGSFSASLDELSPVILYALRSLGPEGIGRLADVSEGLENPIHRRALEASDTTELLSLLKTKRYTMARLKRILMHAVLGTTAELQSRAVSEPGGLYLRVLYAGEERGGELLAALSRSASLPVIIRGKDVQKLSGTALEVYLHSKRAAGVRALACPKNRSAGKDFVRFTKAD